MLLRPPKYEAADLTQLCSLEGTPALAPGPMKVCCALISGLDGYPFLAPTSSQGELPLLRSHFQVELGTADLNVPWAQWQVLRGSEEDLGHNLDEMGRNASALSQWGRVK